MSIRKTIITAIVGLTLVAAIVPVSAGALTTAELQTQINALMAQLATLQGTSGSTPVPTGVVACAGVTFTRNLTVGSTGQDVKCLQVLLNTNGYTLAASGAGSPGMETSYFGPRTLAVVRQFQEAKGMVPANQVGPMTRAAFNAMLNGTSVPPTTGLPQGCTSTSGFSPVTGASCATGVTNPTSNGPVSALLSSTTPAAGAIIGGQALAGMLDVNFTGNGTVTSVTLQRTGVSDQNTLTNVYLFDGNTRITDGYSFNVAGQLVMNGLNIAVNGSKVISVRADVVAGAVSTASSIATSLVGYTANGTTSTASVVGNTMMIVTGTPATTYLGANTVYNTNTQASVNAGTSQYTFWSAPVQVNTRAVVLKTANFRMVGSAPSDALSNIKLFVDGVDTGKTATVITISGSNYASFDLTSAPINLATGSHTLDVRADVQKGSYRTIQLSVQQASDLMIGDTQIGINIAALGAGGVAFTSNIGANVLIAQGSVTVTVDPTFTSATNVSAGSTNVVIGRFKIHAYGEDIKVSSLNVIPSILGATSTGATCTTDGTTGAVTSGTCGLNNVTLYFNGSQIGSQVNYSSPTYTMGKADVATLGTAIPFTLGSQMIVAAGQDSIIEVRADLQTTGNIAYTGGTVKVGLPLGVANAQGQNSQNTVVVPAAAVATSGLAIQSATLVVSKATGYASQSVSPNTAGVKIGSYVVQNQSTSEAVRLTSLNVVITPTTTTLTNFSALKTSDATGSGSTPVQPTGNDTFSVADVLQPGASMTIDIFANTGADTTGSIVTKLTVASIGATSNIASAGTQQTGQTISLGTGTVGTPSVITSTTTPAQYIAAAGGADNASQITFNFVSASGASTVTELKFTVSGSDANPTQTVTKICVGTICGSPAVVSGTQTAYLTGLNLAVPNGGGGLTQNVQVSYANVGTNGIASNSSAAVTLSYVKYTSGGATQTLSPTVPSPTITLVGSKPTIVVAAGQNTGMVLNASTKVGQVSITADAKGDIRLRQLNFNVGYSGYSTSPTSIASGFLTLGGQGSAISGVTCTVVSTTNMVCGTHSGDGVAYTYANDSTLAIPAGTTQQFDLYITTAGGANTGTNKASISTSLVNGASASATAGTTAAFLWSDTASSGTTGAGLTGSLIYSFPTNSYTVSQ